MGWESAQAPLLPPHPLSLKPSGPSDLGWACQYVATLSCSPRGENPLPSDGGRAPRQRPQLPAVNTLQPGLQSQQSQQSLSFPGALALTLPEKP